MTERKRWVEVALMPLVVAVVGTLGTYLLTSQQREAAEARAAADRQIKILEIVADKITSSDESQQIFALRLTSKLDPDLSAKLVTAFDLQGVSERVRNVANEVTVQAVASTVRAAMAATEDPRAAIEGVWVLRRQDKLPGSPVTKLEMKIDATGLTVLGDSWTGKVTFDGKQGYYLWEFKDGRSGRTDIYLDETGILYGKVKGSGIDWTYWASREIHPARARRE